MKKYPKVQQLNSKFHVDIFNEEIEVSEKLDGSQFRFCIVNDGLECCSKGKTLDLETSDKIFKPAIATCKKIVEKKLIDKAFIYIGETLCKPKHNALSYDEVPKGNIALFAIYDIITASWVSHNIIEDEADRLGIDVVPLLFKGIVQNLLN